MPRDDDTQRLDLAQAAELLLNECRMVLPGIQALFGFQMVAVFTERFARLPPASQALHGLAIALVMVSIALIMTPAACHRHGGARDIDDRFIATSARLLVASMAPLALALALEFYLVAGVVWPHAPAAPMALALLALFAALWIGVPRLLGRRRAG